MMNQRNVLQKITAGLLLMLLWALVFPVLAQENELAITAKQNLALQSKPDYDSDVLGVFQRGEQATAFGRDEAGGWLHIAEGWVIAKNVEAAGDIMTLPVTTDAVTVKAASKRSLRSGPDDSFDVTGDLPSGEAALALGRNGGGSWLQVSGGWIPADQVAISGDVMALPITFSSITITASQNAALHRGPSRDTEVAAILERGESLIATSRNEAGTALQTPKGWVFINRGLALDGEVMELPPVHTVSVTAAQALTLYRRPSHDSNRQAVVQQGEQAIAFGRDETGIWLQIPGGWVSAEQGLELDGDAMRLPITGHAGITITPGYSGLTVRGGPSVASDIVRSLQKGEVLAIGRNEKGTWLQIESGWVYAAAARADGDVMSLPVTSGESSTQSIAKASARDGITITPAFAASTIWGGPGNSFDRVGRLQGGEKALAIGRNEKGTWLRIEGGWVLAAWVKTDGDIMDLPVTSGESSTQSIAKASSRDGVTITPAYSAVTVRSGPSGTSDIVGRLQQGEEALAIGRNEKGKIWLRISQGWVPASSVRFNGDIMSLPVTWETTSAASSPTPARSSASAFNVQTIRSRVNRYTDDIRILKITQRGSTTSIEYDLKSWFLVPNESIAKEVVFKVICALRRGGQIPHKLEFVGQGNFKSDVGRKFRSPSVEIHISASNANRIVCSGNNYTDINWRSLSSFYKSYPVPRGATVDD